MQYSAVHRMKPSVTIQWLKDKGLLVGEMLDYGCGKGLDADYFGMDKYDAYSSDWCNISLTTEKKYDTIVCNFVLNVWKQCVLTENVKKSGDTCCYCDNDEHYDKLVAAFSLLTKTAFCSNDCRINLVSKLFHSLNSPFLRICRRWI